MRLFGNKVGSTAKPWKISLILLILCVLIYGFFNVSIFTGTYVLTSIINQSMGLILTSIGQTLIMLTGGIDLSLGGIVALSNCLASRLFTDSVLLTMAGCLLILCCGTVLGAVNGYFIVYRNIQPFIATLASASVFNGLALFIRPNPGGSIPMWFGDMLAGQIFAIIPLSLIYLLLITWAVGGVFLKSKKGLWIYAVGSSRKSAFLSGVDVKSTRMAVYMMGGFFASLAGLFLSAQTLSGNAMSGGSYLLQPIVAVVIGGTSLTGGTGGIYGSIYASLVLSLVSGILFFSGINPLAQPLFEGFVLLSAVLVGAGRIFMLKNQIEILRN